MINPIQSNQASAIPIDTDSGSSGDTETDTTPSISLAIEGATNQTTNVTAGEVAYRTNIFNVTANRYRDFSVMLATMNGYGSELRGKENPNATIEGVGDNVLPNHFKDNTWGYAVSDEIKDEIEKTLLYSTVPSGKDGAAIIADYKYRNENEWNIARNYKLAFAAKIGNNSPADHY